MKEKQKTSRQINIQEKYLFQIQIKIDEKMIKQVMNIKLLTDIRFIK